MTIDFEQEAENHAWPGTVETGDEATKRLSAWAMSIWSRSRQAALREAARSVLLRTKIAIQPADYGAGVHDSVKAILDLMVEDDD